jgi:hypothetical protein
LDEILLGVVNHLVGADRSDHVHVPGAADPGHLRCERFGDLHCKRTHASRRTVDQRLVPRPDLSFVTKTLEGGDGGDGHGRGLLERQVGRFQHNSLFGSRHILGKGPEVDLAEYLIAWLKLGDVPADRFDPTGHITAQNHTSWFERPSHHAHEIRRTSQEVPVVGADGGRVDSYQHLIIGDHRLVDFLEFKDIR